MPFVLANVLQPLIDVFEAVMVFFHDEADLSWGFAIVALTVSVRAAIFPLTLKSLKAMRRLQQYMPELKALQERHKDDKPRQSQEVMKFYRENKVNPASSCLPIVFQIPVFIALFFMLREDLRFDICGQTAKPCGEVGDGDFSQGFLFVSDLTDKASGVVLVALMVAYVGSQLASGLLAMATADPTQRRLMMALPFIFIPFIPGFPAGLIVYWITTNVWTIGQQLVIKRIVPPPPRPGSGGAGVGGAGAKPLSGGGAGGEAQAPTATTTPPRSPRKKRKRSGKRR